MKSNKTWSITDAILGIVRQLFLLPHGSKLLTTPTTFWISGMCFIAYAMAIIEGYTWFQAAKAIFKDFPPLFYFCVGAVIGCGVWFLDAQFITLDTQKDDDKETGLILKSLNRLNLGWLAGKLFWGAILRLGIVLISITVTSNFLTRLFDENRVNAEIKNFNTYQNTKCRKDITRKRKEDIESQKEKINSVKSQLITFNMDEINGKRGDVTIIDDKNKPLTLRHSGKKNRKLNAPMTDFVNNLIKENNAKIENLEMIDIDTEISKLTEDQIKTHCNIEVLGSDYETKIKVSANLNVNHDVIIDYIIKHNKSEIVNIIKEVNKIINKKENELLHIELKEEKKNSIKSQSNNQDIESKKIHNKQIEKLYKVLGYSKNILNESTKLKDDTYLNLLTIEYGNMGINPEFWRDDIKTKGIIKTELGLEEAVPATIPFLGFSEKQTFVSGGLAFLFVALIAFKIYQIPASKIYYDGTLQQYHKSYLKGLFDKPTLISDPNEYHDGIAPMGADRFNDWYYRIYKEHDPDKEQRIREMVALKARKEQERQAIEVLYKNILSEEQTVIDGKNELLLEKEKYEHEKSRIEEALKNTKSDIEKIKNQIEILDFEMDTSERIDILKKSIVSKNELKEKLEDEIILLKVEKENSDQELKNIQFTLKSIYPELETVTKNLSGL